MSAGTLRCLSSSHHPLSSWSISADFLSVTQFLIWVCVIYILMGINIFSPKVYGSVVGKGSWVLVIFLEHIRASFPTVYEAPRLQVTTGYFSCGSLVLSGWKL